MAKITYTDKIDARTSSLNREYKVVASDMNEIKNSVNVLYDDKQDLLIPGTNIQTINGSSILTSGNLSFQETLVPGTSIQTINGLSILTSGNLSLQETLVSGNNIKTINGSSILGSGNISISDTTLFDGGATLSSSVTNLLAGFDFELRGGATVLRGVNDLFGNSNLILKNDTGIALLDFKNDGNVVLGAQTQSFYSRNTLPLLTFHEVGASHNQIIYGEENTAITPTNNDLSHLFVGLNGVATGIAADTYNDYEFIFTNADNTWIGISSESGETSKLDFLSGTSLMGLSYAGSELTIGTGVVKVQGADALSSSSAFQIFNTDTADVKLWDFRNNGDVYSSVDNWTIYNDTLPLFSSHKINAGHNQLILGERDTPITPTNNDLSQVFVGKDGVATGISDNEFNGTEFLFTNADGTWVQISAEAGDTATIGLNSGTVQSLIQQEGNLTSFYQRSPSSNFWLTHYANEGTVYGYQFAHQQTGNFDSGVTHMFIGGDVQFYTGDKTSGVSGINIGKDLRWRISAWDGATTYNNEVKIGINGDTSGNYWAEFKNSANTVGFKINGNDALPMLPEYTVAGVPSADANNTGGLVAITDETGGYTVAFSDGTNWRRVQDRVIIS